MIPRLIQEMVVNSLEELRKVALIIGPRQAGKTTILKAIKNKFETDGMKVGYLNCDLAEDMSVVDNNSLTELSRLVRDLDCLLVDEAQQLTNAGLTFKILYDNFPKLKLVATGSSSFELKNQMSDAMTGRYVDFILYPPGLTELRGFENARTADFIWPHIMLYGSYPEVYLQPKLELKRILLDSIVESYLFKDVLAFSGIRNPQRIRDLTRALAYQIGSEMNENELANRLKIDRKTVVAYLDVLEKAYVIKRLYPYSKNPRREIGRRYKVYFVDLGIRNALIGDFNDIALRMDAEMVWENLLFMERMKRKVNLRSPVNNFFWRSYSGAEVDYLEVSGQKIAAWEFKFGLGKLSRGAREFEKIYKSKVTMVNIANLLEFVRP
ncbi:MAG: ATP-binding protein [Patescibacteria group bacterium]